MKEQLIKDLQELKPFLPKNYASTVATKTGLSIALVFGVISGVRFNKEIIEELISLAETEKKSLNKISKRIKSI